MDDLTPLLDRELVVDVHFHAGASAARFESDPRFAFEKPADSDGYASYLSPRIVSSIGWRIARRLYGLSGAGLGDELDRRMTALAIRHFDAAPSVDRAVVLAFDQYHTDDGDPVGPARASRVRATDLYVSNSYAWEFCRRYPGRFLFGASIHPYHRDALGALEQVAAGGAVLVKWLPIVQNIDITDERTLSFVRRAAELRVPLLIHYGGEKTLVSAHREFADPRPLFQVIDCLHRENVRPTIIIAHVAAGTNWPVTVRGYIRETIAALAGPYRHDHVYADTAAGALFSRAHWLKRLAAMPDIRDKLLFGTDFPVPPTPLCFPRQLGRHFFEVAALRSLVEQDYRIKQAIGFDREFFLRSWRVLREGLRQRIDLVS